MSLNLAIVIEANAANLEQQVEKARAAIDRLGQTAEQAGRKQAGLQQTIDRNTGADRVWRERGDDIKAYGDELDRLRARYNPVFAAQSQYRAELKGIAEAQRVGAISSNEAAGAVQRLNSVHVANLRNLGAATAAAQGHAGAVRLQGYQIANLSQQIQDVGVMLASGQSPFIILAQQGPQITSAMGGVRNALALVAPFFTATTVGIAGITAGLAAGLVAHLQYANSMGEVNRALQISGHRIDLTRGQMELLARATSDAGTVTVKEARSITAAYIAAGITSGAVLRELSALTEDYARLTGQDATAAAAELAKAMKDPARLAQQLSDSYGLLSAAQIRQIQLAATQAEKDEARLVLTDAMNARFKGLATDGMGWLERKWHAIAQAANNAWDAMGGIGRQKGIVELWQDAEDRAAQSAIGPRRLDSSRRLIAPDAQSSADRAEADALLPTAWLRLEIENRHAFSASTEAARKSAQDLALALAPLQIRQDELIRQQKVLAAATLETASAEELRRAGLERVTHALATLMSPTEKMLANSRIEAEALKLPVAERERYIATAKAELDTRGELLTASERQQRIAQAGIDVTVRQTAAARDMVDALEMQAQYLRVVAAAHAVSNAEGQKAEALMAGRMAKLQNPAVDPEAYAEALLQVRGAEAARELSRQREAARIAAGNAGRLAGVVPGSEMSEEIARQIEMEAAALRARAAAGGESNAQIERELALLDAATRARLQATQQIQRETRERQALQAEQIAGLRVAVAMETDPNRRRALELQIERQIKLNELVARYGTDQVQINRELAIFDRTQVLADTARYFTDVREKARELSGDVKQFLLDGFVAVEKGGKSAFASIWEGAKAGAKRFAANLAATLLEQKLILPIATQVVGAMPGLFGIATPQGGAAASGAGGLFGGLGSLLTGSSSIGTQGPPSVVGIGDWISRGSSLLNMNFSSGASMLASNPFANVGYAANSIAGALGIGGGVAATQAAAATYGISAGQAAMLANSGALGAGALSPLAATGIGAAIAIAAIVAMSMMGGKKSVGPNATAGLSYRDGQFITGNRGADNGGDLAGVVGAMDAFAAGLNTLQSQYGVRPANVDTGNPFAPVVNPAGGGFGLGTWTYANGGELMRAMIRQRALTGNGAIGTVLDGRDYANDNEVTLALQAASAIDALAANDNSPLRQALDAVNEKFNELAGIVDKAGLSMEKLNEARQKELAQTLDSQLRSGGAAGLMALIDQLTIGPQSVLSPGEQLAALESATQSAFARAMGGDAAGLAEFAGNAGTLLQGQRAYYGTTGAYVDVQEKILRQVRELLDRQTGGLDTDIYLQGEQANSLLAGMLARLEKIEANTFAEQQRRKVA